MKPKPQPYDPSEPEPRGPLFALQPDSIHRDPDHIRERRAVWTFDWNGEPVRTFVRIVDVRFLAGGTRLLVETNAGDQTWVRSDKLRLLDLPQNITSLFAD